jgi:hypothetical protein
VLVSLTFWLLVVAEAAEFGVQVAAAQVVILLLKTLIYLREVLPSQ